MSYTYYQAKNPTTINDEVITESELSERLLELNNKTTAITYHPEKEDEDIPEGTTPAYTSFNSSVHVHGEVTSVRLNNLYTNTYNITYDAPSKSTLISNIRKASIISFNDDKSVKCYETLTAPNITSTNKTDIESLQSKTQNILRIPGTDEDPTSYTEIDGVSFQTTLERISNIEGTLTKVSYDPLEEQTTISGKLTVNGNITASNLTGIAYNSNLQLQGTDYCSATILNQHLYIELTAVTYAPHLGLRIHKTNLSNGQELMLQVGKDNTRAISFVYKHYDTIANSQYRLGFAGKSAYICNYGATSKTEHEIRGNLKVYGSVTENASRTITHYTMYE